MLKKLALERFLVCNTNAGFGRLSILLLLFRRPWVLSTALILVNGVLKPCRVFLPDETAFDAGNKTPFPFAACSSKCRLGIASHFN